MSLFHEENQEDEDESEEFTSNTRTVSVTLPAWLIIAIDEKRGDLIKRSTLITHDLEPKYIRHKDRIIKEMYAGATRAGLASRT